MATRQESGRKILVINCGSSSLKYEVYDMPGRVSLGKCPDSKNCSGRSD